MATVPQTQTIKPEDFKKDDQEIASRIAEPFNAFTEQLVETINRDLTFGENFRGEVRTFTFTSTNLTTTFKYNGKGTPSHLWISKIDTEPLGAIIPYWSQDGRGNITVTLKGTYTAITQLPGAPYTVTATETSVLSPSTNYKITFIIASE